MTKPTEAVHQNALEYCRSKISGCFGIADGIFAGHPYDEKRANELRQFAAQNEITFAEIKDIALDYMHEKKFHNDHVYEQLLEVTKFFKKKLG